MPFFIKTEKFTKETQALPPKKRAEYLFQHKIWVKSLKDSGQRISSGYLANNEAQPGGGGLLLIEANSYEEAKGILEQDPMIINKLVNWEINQWVPIPGNFIELH